LDLSKEIMQQKILVGCPTSDYHGYCLQEYTQAVKSLTYPNYDVLLVDNSKDDSYLKKLKSLDLSAMKGHWYEGAKDRIVSSRNILRKQAIQQGYDFLLSLEQDIIPPKDIIERLLHNNKDIVSAVYFMPYNNTLTPMLGVNQGKEKYSYLSFEQVDKSSEVININYVGLGAILISKRVLEKIKFRIDKKPGFDDWWFCKDAEREGFKIYADLSVKCKHLLNNRPWSWTNIKL